MKVKVLFCTCMALFATCSIQAQIHIRGTVTDEKGAAIPGAAVTVEGMTGTGGACASDGSYGFEIHQSGQKSIVLVASAIGYDTMRRRIRTPDGSYEENFILCESQEQLETVVVTATSRTLRLGTSVFTIASLTAGSVARRVLSSPSVTSRLTRIFRKVSLSVSLAISDMIRRLKLKTFIKLV